jgi:hypothetical protein
VIYTTKHTQASRTRRKILEMVRELPYVRRGLCRQLLFASFICFMLPQKTLAVDLTVLKPDAFVHYITHFNSMQDENVTNFIANADSWDWLQQNIPFFACPDPEVEEMYYFRWWSFRKHLVKTTNGFVFTEFLTPVHWAGSYNTISCAVGHHLMEGRWLHDERYVDDYILFWLRGHNDGPQPHFHNFSSWFAAAVYDCYLVNHDRHFVTNVLDDLVADYQTWQRDHQLTNGLYWQYDVRDGMEESISGSRHVKNMRPTINSYMFGNARAIAAIARLAGRERLAQEFDERAARLKRLAEKDLWNSKAKFFEALHPNGKLAGVREEIGFIPWYFDLPEPGRGYELAWTQLADPEGFQAPYGITTAERRSPEFRSHGYGHCEWDGAVWPFATSQTLTALANVLRDYKQSVVTRKNYFDAFLTYAECQHADGKPYIGEYLDETTGQWINGRGGRSRYYNHSTFADLLITGVVGLVPRADKTVEVWPLLPDDTWNRFCLDGVNYHGHILTILWDQDGTHYGHGTGLTVLADGKEIAHAESLTKLQGKLP